MFGETIVVNRRWFVILEKYDNIRSKYNSIEEGLIWLRDGIMF